MKRIAAKRIAAKAVLFLVVAALCGLGAPLYAHHSFQAQYDESHPLTLMGTVSKVVWKNPHVQVDLNVKNSSGKLETWELELASPNALLRQGWKVDSLKAGDQITVEGFGARDGSHLASARKVVLAGH